MDIKTVADQGPAIKALYRLLNQYPHLPAAAFDPGTVIVPAGVVPGIGITLHNGFADFEAWREALNIDGDTVEHRQRLDAPSGSYQLLRGYGTFGEVAVQIQGFAPLGPEATAAA
ncbi:hypothetical protein [Streptomyces sp. NPDC051162]|uniref:hypothetical protein n=1 Tax=Streptomyces sp. NPDC051162 TaxID=3154747 RepID=UPI00342FC152